MSKIGVGVGDEFPVDDGNKPNNANNNGTGATGSGAPPDDRAEFEEWKRRRDADRAQREQWRAQREDWHRRKDEWKQQWREQRRTWRDQMRAQHGDGANGDFAYPYGGRRYYGRGRFPWFFGGHGVARLLGLFAVIALVIFAISHIGYIIAGLVAVAVLFAAYHHFGHDPLDFGHYAGGRDYGRPINNPPPAPTQAVTRPAGSDTNGTANTTGPQNT
jgi:hypothetical protein